MTPSKKKFIASNRVKKYLNNTYKPIHFTIQKNKNPQKVTSKYVSMNKNICFAKGFSSVMTELSHFQIKSSQQFYPERISRSSPSHSCKPWTTGDSITLATIAQNSRAVIFSISLNADTVSRYTEHTGLYCSLINLWLARLRTNKERAQLYPRKGNCWKP